MYLVIDVGGTFIKNCIMSRDGEIVCKGESISTPYSCSWGMKDVQKGIDAFLDTIYGIYSSFKDDYDIQGIAMSMPGQIDVDNGIVYGGGALPYLDGERVGDLISRKCDGISVAIENDGKCAALAEVWQGNGRDCRDVVVIVFGTGIGGGIVIDRKILHGRGMVAGEMSYLFENVTRDNLYDLVPLEENMKNNSEGFELPKDSTWSMQASVMSVCHKVADAKNLPRGEVDGKLIYKLEEDGDADVHEILESWYLNIAKHCMNMHVLLAPDMILLGGGISAQPKFIEGVKKYVRILSKFSIIYNEMNIGLCKFGNDSNMIGALFNYLQKYEDEE